MTFATKITVARLVLVPVFAAFAISYGMSVEAGDPKTAHRWIALAIFITAAASDGIDGWIARRFNQTSELGAFLDPLADKALVLSAIIILTIFAWGPLGWSIPLWFTALVILRDSIILAGIRYLNHTGKKVNIRPHWTGKICTFSLFFVLGWVMLQPVAVSPIFPCAAAAVFLVLSMVEYIRQGMGILKNNASAFDCSP